MKHLITISAVLASLLASSNLNALPIHWDVELTAQPPQVFSLQRPRGETYELEAVLKNRGKPFEPAITNACIYWQTNGMENLYWSAPASVSNNVLLATWLPSMDPGATTVRGYIGDPGHIYAAAFQFRFISSPGETPNELPLPQKVIDFAKVTVLNPPWSGGGGGGGVDTNAVIDIIHRTVDGSARYTPKYLWVYDCADSYPDDATWYYSQPQDYGHCSAVRDGGFLYRNYDWKFDSASEFVVRMAAGHRRFASIGVANCGTNLTEEIVASGKPSRYFKCLPGRTVDGINEHGVCAEVNVVGGDPHESGWTTNGTIHCFGAVRWVLDHATNAASAASVLASEVYFPSGLKQNFHWMIADETSTYIVENGEAHPVTGAVLTNFRLYPTRDTSGEGQERYDALVSGASITSQWWTLTYTPDGYRARDLPGISGETLTNLFNYWSSKPRESHRGETITSHTSDTSETSHNLSWWQTVHTSVYDLTNRTLRIAVQEQDDWYVFAVPSAGGVKPEVVREIVEPLIVEATNELVTSSVTNGLRSVLDMSVYTNEFSTFAWSSENQDLISSLGNQQPTFTGTGWFISNEHMNGWTMILPEVSGSADDTTIRIQFDKYYGPAPWEYEEASAVATRTHSIKDTSDSLATTNGVNAAISANEKTGTNQQIVRGRREDDKWDISVSSASHSDSSDSSEISIHSYESNEATSAYKIIGGDWGSIEGVTEGSYGRFRVIDDLHPEGFFIEPPQNSLRLYDYVRHCWWIGTMVNGVINWEVE